MTAVAVGRWLVAGLASAPATMRRCAAGGRRG